MRQSWWQSCGPLTTRPRCEGAAFAQLLQQVSIQQAGQHLAPAAALTRPNHDITLAHTQQHSRRAASSTAPALMMPLWYHLLKLPMSGLQTKSEKKYLNQFGLDLINGAVINNVEAGVLEPALAKTKIIQVMASEQHAPSLSPGELLHD